MSCRSSCRLCRHSWLRLNRNTLRGKITTINRRTQRGWNLCGHCMPTYVSSILKYQFSFWFYNIKTTEFLNISGIKYTKASFLLDLGLDNSVVVSMVDCQSRGQGFKSPHGILLHHLQCLASPATVLQWVLVSGKMIGRGRGLVICPRMPRLSKWSR